MAHVALLLLTIALAGTFCKGSPLPSMKGSLVQDNSVSDNLMEEAEEMSLLEEMVNEISSGIGIGSDMGIELGNDIGSDIGIELGNDIGSEIASGRGGGQRYPNIQERCAIKARQQSGWGGLGGRPNLPKYCDPYTRKPTKYEQSSTGHMF